MVKSIICPVTIHCQNSKGRGSFLIDFAMKQFRVLHNCIASKKFSGCDRKQEKPVMHETVSHSETDQFCT